MSDQPQQVPLTQATPEQLQNILTSNVIQREIFASNVSQIVGEILRRQQQAQQPAPTESEIKLPKLKKLEPEFPKLKLQTMPPEPHQI